MNIFPQLLLATKGSSGSGLSADSSAKSLSGDKFEGLLNLLGKSLGVSSNNSLFNLEGKKNLSLSDFSAQEQEIFSALSKKINLLASKKGTQKTSSAESKNEKKSAQTSLKNNRAEDEAAQVMSDLQGLLAQLANIYSGVETGEQSSDKNINNLLSVSNLQPKETNTKSNFIDKDLNQTDKDALSTILSQFEGIFSGNEFNELKDFIAQSNSWKEISEKISTSLLNKGANSDNANLISSEVVKTLKSINNKFSEINVNNDQIKNDKAESKILSENFAFEKLSDFLKNQGIGSEVIEKINLEIKQVITQSTGKNKDLNSELRNILTSKNVSDPQAQDIAEQILNNFEDKVFTTDIDFSSTPLTPNSLGSSTSKLETLLASNGMSKSQVQDIAKQIDNNFKDNVFVADIGSRSTNLATNSLETGTSKLERLLVSGGMSESQARDIAEQIVELKSIDLNADKQQIEFNDSESYNILDNIQDKDKLRYIYNSKIKKAGVVEQEHNKYENNTKINPVKNSDNQSQIILNDSKNIKNKQDFLETKGQNVTSAFSSDVTDESNIFSDFDSSDQRGSEGFRQNGQEFFAGSGLAGKPEFDFGKEILTTSPRSDSSNIMKQIEQGAFKELTAGKKQLVLRLDPAELGSVHVTLQIKDKDVHAILKASSPEAARLISDQAQQLRQSLETQGLKVVRLEVQQQPPSFSEGHQNQGFGQGAGQGFNQTGHENGQSGGQRGFFQSRSSGKPPGWDFDTMDQNLHNVNYRENSSSSSLDVFA